MADWHDGWKAEIWLIGLILRGWGVLVTDRLRDICYSRVAFATEKHFFGIITPGNLQKRGLDQKVSEVLQILWFVHTWGLVKGVAPATMMVLDLLVYFIKPSFCSCPLPPVIGKWTDSYDCWVAFLTKNASVDQFGLNFIQQNCQK